MIQNRNLQSMPQPSAVPYWNMIKDSSREVKEALLNMLYVSLTEEIDISEEKEQTSSMKDAICYLDSASVKNVHVPSNVNGMKDLCYPKYM